MNLSEAKQTKIYNAFDDEIGQVRTKLRWEGKLTSEIDELLSGVPGKVIARLLKESKPIERAHS